MTNVESYYTWRTLGTTLAGVPIRWAGKPGLESWDAIRPATRLLAEELQVEAGQRVLDLCCGPGVCGALAAQRGALVTLCDDSIVAVEAARRTLALNEGSEPSQGSAQVIHGDDVAGPFDLVLLDAPRGREWARYLLGVAARMLRLGGKLLLAGPNRGGIKGFIEDASKMVGLCQVRRIKAGHRLAVAERSGHSSREVGIRQSPSLGGLSLCEAMVRGQPVHFATRPGVFSHGELDAGTRALVETMAIHPDDRVLDLGCGCGIVGAVAARTARQVVWVDSSAAALDTTRRTLELNGVSGLVLASDCAAAVRDMRFDVVATNPPFHQGLGVEYDVAQQFVRDTAEVLAPGGRLFLVANRFIRYERVMGNLFSRVTTTYEDSRFRVLEAIH